MQVEIWSDVVCPWCYIGKRRLEAALARFEHRDEAELVWRSFELDPRAPKQVEGDPAARLAAKYGMTRDEAVAARTNITAVAAREGLRFELDHARAGNTFDAHRLLHLAADRGLGDVTKERLLAAYFTDGEAIGDAGTLLRLAGEVGLDVDDARAVLEGDKYGDEVRGDERRAMALGITSVPFFVVDGTYAVAGAQPAEVLLEALTRAWSERPNTDLTGIAGDADARCGADRCET